MSDLKGQIGELRMTIQIKRKETGKTETVELVGHSDPEKLAEILKEQGATDCRMDASASLPSDMPRMQSLRNQKGQDV